MKISLKWLMGILPEVKKEDVARIADGLTARGIEVESIEHQGKNLEGVVSAQIKTKDKHPNADKLSVLTVDNGTEVLQIVCGATNMVAGDKIALALVGAELPGNFKISKSKIRSVESCGMCCSEVEMGIAEKSEGIMILKPDTQIGLPITTVLGLDDVIMEVSIAPNRGDLLSHAGIAREVAGVLGVEFDYKTTGAASTNQGHGLLNIEIKNLKCPRYIGRRFEGVKVKESPMWLKQRLESIGLRPINNLVDITNYVMLELGHPLHVFDAKHIAHSKIIVRSASENEKLVLLDEKEVTLSSKDMLITDADKAVALAGVMGAQNSGVSNDTQDVILECAYFDPSTIRVTAKKYLISTDSSYRFERGVDYHSMKLVVDKASELIKELAEPQKIYDALDLIKSDKPLDKIRVSVGAVNSFLGLSISRNEIIDVLGSTGFFTEVHGDFIDVTPPSYRNDIKIKEDVYEEVLRLYGYDKVPLTLPVPSCQQASDTCYFDFLNNIRTTMRMIGYNESINYSFVPEKHNTVLGTPDDKIVKIINPITETMKQMRTQLITSLLEAVKYNHNYRNLDVKMYEVGRVYFNTELLTTELTDKHLSAKKFVANEQEQLCAVFCGNIAGIEDWSTPAGSDSRLVDFYRVKGELEAIFKTLRVPNWDYAEVDATKHNLLHPGISASIVVCGKTIGYIGKIHPDLVAAFDLDVKDIFVFELNLNMLFASVGGIPVFKGLPKFPQVRRDVSFVIDKAVEHKVITKYIRKLNIPNLKDYGVFDLYQGKGIVDGKKSMAYYFIFGAEDRTLVDSDVDSAFGAITQELKKQFLIEIR